MPEVPGYVLRERIGRGADATVWRAEPAGSPGRLVAVKLIDDPAPGAARIIEREAEALARLSHPSILQVLDIVPLDDGLALVTPFTTGGSLAARLAATPGGLDPQEVCEVGARLASALAVAHDAGLVHRDVKPANVLFDREAQPLLADFGTARLIGAVDDVAGTPGYLDPDVPAGQPPDAATDIYALGVTLYECLAGVPPYAGATPMQTLAAADRGLHVPLGDHLPLPDGLIVTVETAMARHRTERQASANELAGDLDELGRALRAGSAPPPPPHRPTGRAGVLGAQPPDGDRTGQRPGRSMPRWTLIAAAAAIVAVPVVIAVASLLGGEDTVGLLPLTAADDRPAPEADGVAPDDAGGDEARTDAIDPERIAAAPCPGVTIDQPSTPLLADIDGRGCSLSIDVDGRELRIDDPDGAPVRFELGADPDDVLLFGDWSCDGRDAPALYRPGDGRIFRFDALVGDDERVTVSGEPSGVTDGVPIVRTDPDGCDRIEVAPGP